MWKKNLPPSFIDNALPKDDEKIHHKVKLQREYDILKTWSEWGSSRVKVTIIVAKSISTSSKLNKKYEKVGEYNYFGPFMLFNKLRELHENNFNVYNSSNPISPKSSQRISGLLQEVKSDSWTNRILQFDILNLFSENKELFWNLIFRFIKDNRDYLFYVSVRERYTIL